MTYLHFCPVMSHIYCVILFLSSASAVPCPMFWSPPPCVRKPGDQSLVYPACCPQVIYTSVYIKVNLNHTHKFCFVYIFPFISVYVNSWHLGMRVIGLYYCECSHDGVHVCAHRSTAQRSRKKME